MKRQKPQLTPESLARLEEIQQRHQAEYNATVQADISSRVPYAEIASSERQHVTQKLHVQCRLVRQKQQRQQQQNYHAPRESPNAPASVDGAGLKGSLVQGRKSSSTISTPGPVPKADMPPDLQCTAKCRNGSTAAIPKIFHTGQPIPGHVCPGQRKGPQKKIPTAKTPRAKEEEIHTE